MIISLLNTDGNPYLYAGMPNSLVLSLENDDLLPLTLAGADSVPPDPLDPGSDGQAVFSMNFPVFFFSNDGLASVTTSSEGWAAYSSTMERNLPQPVTLLSAYPTADVTIPAGGSVSVVVDGLVPSKTGYGTGLTFLFARNAEDAQEVQISSWDLLRALLVGEGKSWRME